MISKNHSNRRAYNWLVYKIGDKFLEKFIDLYKGDMYDLGCGEKPYKAFFENYVDKYIGVDWAGTLHALNADIIADLNKPLPIESGVADTIISLSVMEHLYNPQIMLSESYRILKPGGNIILQVPFQWWIHEEPYDYYRYTIHGLKYMFEEAGFTNIKVEPSSGLFTSIAMKKNYFDLRFVRGPKLLKKIIYSLFIPFWFFRQLLAISMDKIDKNWNLETSGYWVVAQK